MKQKVKWIAEIIIASSGLVFLILHWFNKDNRCFFVLYRVFYLLMNTIIIIRWIEEARQKRKMRDTAEQTSAAEKPIEKTNIVKLKEDYSGIPAGSLGTVITVLTDDYFEVVFHGISVGEVTLLPIPGRLIEKAANG